MWAGLLCQAPAEASHLAGASCPAWDPAWAAPTLTCALTAPDSIPKGPKAEGTSWLAVGERLSIHSELFEETWRLNSLPFYLCSLTRSKFDLQLSQHLQRWLRQYRICLPGRRPGLGSWVGKIPWRREWESTPIFLPKKSLGQRILAS